MDYFTSKPNDVWTRAYSTWIVGTYELGITDNSFASSSVSTTDFGGRSSSFIGSGERYNRLTTVLDGTGGSSSGNQSSYINGTQEYHFTPSTHTEVIGPSGSFTTVTVTDDQTIISTSRTELGTTNLYLTGDTSSQTQGTTSGASSVDTDTTSSSTTGAYSETFTALAATTGIGSSVGTVGYSKLTLTATQEDGWLLIGTSTSSYSYTRATTGTPSTTTATKWTLADTFQTFATSQTVSENTSFSITYYEDLRTTATTTTLVGTNTLTVGHSTATTTYHAHSPLEDTVFLMNGDRASADYNLGNQLWVFSLTGLGEDATTEARLTGLYSYGSGAIRTLADYQKFTTSAIPVTAITRSFNTTATTTSTITASTAGSPPTIATGATDTIIETTYKNGGTWNPSESYISGTSTLYSAAASNTTTATHTFNLGDVSTSMHTEEVGDPVSIISTTHFFGTYQETGYTSSGWTSTTSTSLFAESSATESHLVLHSPATTTIQVDARYLSTDETLISRFSSVGTSWQFIGLGKTTTTRVFTVGVSTTQSIWLANLNPEIEVFSTSSSGTFAPNGINSTSYSKSEAWPITYNTEIRVLPNTWTMPFGSTLDGLGNAWHPGPPHGYGGIGGNFTKTDLPVYLSVSVGLASGGAFGTQTFDTSVLPTALAYSGVTFFPDRTDYSISLPDGAIGAKYISRISNLGDNASVAVTWTTTTLIGTSTVIASTAATYTLAGVSSITGAFYREIPLTFNTSDIRGGRDFKGGYGIGDNALSSDYTVRINAGFVEWTAYSSNSSVSSSSTSSTAGSITFTVPGSLAIVLSAEPIISMSWGEDRGDHFMSSIPHFPTL
jgi:hypothetical protein